MQFEEAQQKAEKRQEEIDRLRDGRGRDVVGNNFERDMMMVQRMYDQGYGRMGSRFAIGDGWFLVWQTQSLILTPNSNCRESAPSANHISSADGHQCPPGRSL